MIEIKKEQNQYRVSFPEESIAQHYVEKLMDYLRYAELFSESKLTKVQRTYLMN